jgi:hypothetical protein
MGAAPAHAIVGGFQTKTQWPAFASLMLNGDHQCGASLIRRQWLVTGAHCVIDHSPSDYMAIVGPSERNVGTQLAVKSIVIHPGYSQETIPILKAAWDVAVVELAHPVDVVPIRIPGGGEEDLYKPGTPAVTIGFGDTDFVIGAKQTHLWEADIPVVSDADCNLQYAGRFDPDEHICGGSGDGNGTCNGDSGGPTRGTYDVFARVSSKPLREWINAHVAPLEPAAPALPATPAGQSPTPDAAVPTSSPAAPARAQKRSTKSGRRKASRTCARVKGKRARARCVRRHRGAAGKHRR